MTPSAAGKGDDNRVSDYKKYRENFDNIFKKKTEEVLCPLCDNIGFEEISKKATSMGIREFVCLCCDNVWAIDS